MKSGRNLKGCRAGAESRRQRHRREGSVGRARSTLERAVEHPTSVSGDRVRERRESKLHLCPPPHPHLLLLRSPRTSPTRSRWHFSRKQVNATRASLPKHLELDPGRLIDLRTASPARAAGPQRRPDAVLEQLALLVRQSQRRLLEVGGVRSCELQKVRQRERVQRGRGLVPREGDEEGWQDD